MTTEYYKIQTENEVQKDDLFYLKKKTLLRKMSLLEKLLDERKTNLNGNLQEIQENMCFCNALCRKSTSYDQQLYNKIQLQYKLPLYKELRQIKTDFLADTSLLKKDLIDTVIEYYGLGDKQSFLE